MQLQKFTLQDAARVADLIGDEAVSRWTTSIPHPCSVEEARSWISNFALLPGKHVYAVVRDQLIVACVCYWPYCPDNQPTTLASYEIGYWVGQAYWGQGIATAALQLMLNQPDFPPARQLVAQIFSGNTGSARVLGKLGFVYTEACTLQRQGVSVAGHLYTKQH